MGTLVIHPPSGRASFSTNPYSCPSHVPSGPQPGRVAVQAKTHFSKLKSGKRMLFLMKMVKFSASLMMGLWAGAGT